jgi:hypothetical protein
MRIVKWGKVNLVQSYMELNNWMTVNNKLERTWKEVVMAEFKVMSIDS